MDDITCDDDGFGENEERVIEGEGKRLLFSKSKKASSISE